ncbi:PepSY domain-containing protein [Thiothrix lacustris]|uniref:PepSY domain-containing protein n=1 Tax=Thiothrix lacustris TaxID=525917 RepID=UPI0027E3F13A|nr:PepSY domain-containing protein [Thiothrix lacustris]WMP18764.1 PepSY domain-containing protein [Thiothrix lacustris]
MNAKILTMVSGLLVVAAIGSASANPATPNATASAKPDVFATLASTKTTLDSAIQTAEHTVTGTLLKAGVDNETTPAAYRVAIADSKSRTVTYFKIDSVTGKVVDSRILRPDKQTAKTTSKPNVTNTANSAGLMGKVKAPAVKAPIATAPIAPMGSTTTPAAKP